MLQNTKWLCWAIRITNHGERESFWDEQSVNLQFWALKVADVVKAVCPSSVLCCSFSSLCQLKALTSPWGSGMNPGDALAISISILVWQPSEFEHLQFQGQQSGSFVEYGLLVALLHNCGACGQKLSKETFHNQALCQRYLLGTISLNTWCC